MIIEIRATGFGNKGAELMLCAVIEALAPRLKGVRFVVEPSIGSYEARMRYGLYQKLCASRYGRAGWLIDRLMHEGYRRKYGLVAERETDAVLDAAGYAYGDAWGSAGTETLARNAGNWKRSGKRVLLLPQAFGPFQDPRNRRAFTSLLRSVDRVFARDAESLEHIRMTGAGLANVRAAPDFTNGVQAALPGAEAPGGHSACIVPNSRMIRHTPPAVRRRYVPFLTACIRRLEQKGIPCFLLPHCETEDDALIREIISAHGTLPVVREPDPRVLKGIIGRSYVLVGSRYHALVSALCQAVPSLGTSWSHKYRCLFEDYGCGECLLTPDVPPAAMERALDRLVDEPERSRRVARLRRHADDIRRKTVAMWDDVCSVLMPDP